MKNKILKVLFALSALLPLIPLFGKPTDPLLLPYSLFVILYFFKNRIDPFKNISIPPELKLALLTLFIGFGVETLAWVNNYFAKRANPILFHPQLIYDLLISFALYGGWAIGWFLILKKFKFTTMQVFLTQGLFGIMIEQQGQVFIKGLTAMPLGLLMWIYVFLAYAPIMGLSYIFMEKQFIQKNKSNRFLKYFAAIIILAIINISFFLIWTPFLDKIGVIPDPKPIWTSPFW